jgi:hypothetical protein
MTYGSAVHVSSRSGGRVNAICSVEGLALCFHEWNQNTNSLLHHTRALNHLRSNNQEE